MNWLLGRPTLRVGSFKCCRQRNFGKETIMYCVVLINLDIYVFNFGSLAPKHFKIILIFNRLTVSVYM
jgi:hypothetical protein